MASEKSWINETAFEQVMRMFEPNEFWELVRPVLETLERTLTDINLAAQNGIATELPEKLDGTVTTLEMIGAHELQERVSFISHLLRALNAPTQQDITQVSQALKATTGELKNRLALQAEEL